MEIVKTLTLSTAHISSDTARWIDSGQSHIIAYPKADYGWFIYFGDTDKEKILQEDIKRIFELAQAKNCDLICIDRDGEVVDGLPIYNW